MTFILSPTPTLPLDNFTSTSLLCAGRVGATGAQSHGYFGIAVYKPKTWDNWGGILRNAHAFGAAFVSLIGHRYRQNPTDTSKAARHLPVFVHETLEQFMEHQPHDCEIVRVEVDGGKALQEFTHLPRAIYLFGGEDQSVPTWAGNRSVRIETRNCLNLATTTGIVMFDRTARC